MMKSWKRIAALVTSAVMAGAMLTSYDGGGKTAKAAEGNGPKTETGTQAGKDAGETAGSGRKEQVYVFIHDRDDLSYWDSMAASGDRAVADYAGRAGVHVVETTADLQANLQAMYEAADKGADLIITVSDFKDNPVEAANEYPDIAFTIINEDVVDQCENNSTYGVDFTISRAAFLGGIAAADVAANGAESMDPANVIDFIGDMNESLAIQEFPWDYAQDVQYYNPDIKIAYNYVSTWNDPNTAKTQAMTQYNSAGVNVIFAYAGGSGNGVHNAAEEAQRFVIGVDSDQSQLYEDDRAIQERFLTSVVREVNNAAYNMIEEYLDNGTLPYGKYEVLGLSDGAVGIVEDDQLNGALSGEDKAKLEEAKTEIAGGSIEAKSVIGKGQNEIKAFTNENCQQGKKRQLIGMLEDWKKER